MQEGERDMSISSTRKKKFTPYMALEKKSYKSENQHNSVKEKQEWVTTWQRCI